MSSELISNKVQAITIEDNGTIWAGTDKGISRFDGYNWISYTDIIGITDYAVFDMDVDIDKTIWFATNIGVLHYDEFGFSGVALNNRKNINELKLDVFPTIVNDALTLNYSAPMNSNVVICVMDLNGRIIHRLIEHKVTIGQNKLTWNINDHNKTITAGPYIICISTGKESISKKIVVVR